MMVELKKASVKSKAEAVLFSTGRRISLDDISKLCKARKEDVIEALKELQKEYDEKNSSLMLVEEGDFWKFSVRDHFIPIVRKIVSETELTKSVLETLAVIAFKYPILQSDLIKIRTNKAYDHLAELEAAGYITRQKHSRTNLIKLTDKFFRYFDLTEEKLNDQFKDFNSIAKAIKEKEVEIDKIKEEQRKRAEELKKEDERIKKEIESLDESGEEFEVPVEVYDAKPKGIAAGEFEQQDNLIVEKEKIGDLEVFEEGQYKKQEDAFQVMQKEKQSQDKFELKIEGNKQQTEKNQIQDTKQIFQQEKTKPQNLKKKSEGIKTTPEMEKAIDEKVKEIINPEKKKEENKEV